MTENINNQDLNMSTPQNPQVMPQPVPGQPMPNPQVMPQSVSGQPMPNPQAAPSYQTVTPVTNVTPELDPMAAVSNLNKEEAMEEALSHTTQYSPFQVEQQVVNQAPKKTNNKKAYIFIGIIAAIMAIFILLLPYISKLFM